MANARLVIYRLQICRVRMVYSHWLEIELPDHTIAQARYGDPELDRHPSSEDLAALQRPPAKKKRR